MAIPTSRVKTAAIVSIDQNKCNSCGQCLQVCSAFCLEQRDDQAVCAETSLLECFACGQCQAICPTGAITVNGRELGPEDFFDLPHANSAATFEQILALFQRRRSIRKFSSRPVDPDKVAKILEAAQTAPIGLPPSDVKVLVLNSVEKNRAFAKDFCDIIKNVTWLTAPWFLTLMRPFWGKDNDQMFRNFVKPAINILIKHMDKGENMLTYDAPLSMYFYATPLADPADPIVAATQAMLAGQALGLGTCMIGSVHPFLQWGSRSRRFREKYGITNKSPQGLLVLYGHSDLTFRKGITRTFASIEMLP